MKQLTYLSSCKLTYYQFYNIYVCANLYILVEVSFNYYWKWETSAIWACSKKAILDKKCLIFLYNFHLEHFTLQSYTQNIEMHLGLHVTLFLSDFLTMWNVLTDYIETPHYQIPWKYLLQFSRCFTCTGRRRHSKFNRPSAG